MKRLWALPLAALLCGRPVDPPRLKSPLPSPIGDCAADAQKLFLLAFSYRQESAEESLRYLAKAQERARKCGGPLLRSRIDELRSSFP